MVEFDKNGWFIGQIINTEVKHGENHDHLYDRTEPVVMYIYDKSKYTVHGHTTLTESIEEIFMVVPLYKTKYKGKKFKEWNKKGSGALAIVAKLKKSDRMAIIKILIPK